MHDCSHKVVVIKLKMIVQYSEYRAAMRAINSNMITHAYHIIDLSVTVMGIVQCVYHLFHVFIFCSRAVWGGPYFTGRAALVWRQVALAS